jgi:positive regulator of sigma E activity
MPTNDYVFYLSYTSYKRTRLLAWILMLASLIIALACTVLSVTLWSSYAHKFTPYLKWQDALFATLCYLSLILISGSAMVVRFYYALRAGFYQGMFIQKGGSSLVVRDLSSKNLSSIYWAIGTMLSCFIAALVGLIPEILIGWTIHLPHPMLVVICTAIAILLSLAGLVVTFVAISFILIGWMGCFSFCRKIGAPHTYQLDRQTTIRLDGFVLSITHPHQQEVVFDLNLLDLKDQYRLFSLLQKCWLDAEVVWNPSLGEDIEAARKEVDHFTMLV